MVAPSEGTPRRLPPMVKEGLMYHKICIGSSGTGVSDILKRQDWDGFVFENANADDLRNKLEYMVRGIC